MITQEKINSWYTHQSNKEKVIEEEECEHQFENGRCNKCGEVYEEPDMSGATSGDR
jgi:uncharacterized OB-fold protein